MNGVLEGFLNIKKFCWTFLIFFEKEANSLFNYIQTHFGRVRVHPN